jgi:hypothetical protein
MQVKAIKPGLLGSYRSVGELFTLDSEDDFSSNWMERLKPTKKAKAKQPEPKPAE